MAEYVSNSHKSREEASKKKVEPVVTGKAVKRHNAKRKLTDTFISEDLSNVKSYIVMDILVPAVKKAVSDIVTNGIDMILHIMSYASCKILRLFNCLNLLTVKLLLSLKNVTFHIICLLSCNPVKENEHNNVADKYKDN